MFASVAHFCIIFALFFGFCLPFTSPVLSAAAANRLPCPWFTLKGYPEGCIRISFTVTTLVAASVAAFKPTVDGVLLLDGIGGSTFFAVYCARRALVKWRARLKSEPSPKGERFPSLHGLRIGSTKVSSHLRG